MRKVECSIGVCPIKSLFAQRDIQDSWAARRLNEAAAALRSGDVKWSKIWAEEYLAQAEQHAANSEAIKEQIEELAQIHQCRRYLGGTRDCV